jgi:RimJ/RimL family protein N-acetyltransferase
MYDRPQDISMPLDERNDRPRLFTAPGPHDPGDQPVGPPVDVTPSPRPGPVVLTGRYGGVEKLATAHARDLWDCVEGHDHLWTYMGAYGPFAGAGAFSAWIAERADLADPYAYAIVTPAGRAVGIATLMEIRPAMRVMEVGHIVYTPALQKTPLGTEAQYLLARYAFETRAALRYGFTFEGIFRQHMIMKGRSRDTAWFSMLDTEWPVRKTAFERWLDPANFDADGRQKQSLSRFGAGAAPN